MKKTLLKVASLIMMLAMVITAVVIPNETAKADEKEMEFVIILPETETRVAKVLLDFEWNGAGLVPDGTKETNPVGWGRDMYTFTKEASENVYKIKLTGTVDAVNDSGLGATIQFVFVNASGDAFDAVKFPLWDTKADNVNAYINNDTLYFNVSLAETATWSEISALTEDPRAAKASDVMAIIDAIGTVELSDDCKTKIEAARSAVDTYSGSESEITNLSKLTAAEAKWTELMAASGKLTLHIKNDAKWDKVSVYSWCTKEEYGSWPGIDAVADENNSGWLTLTQDISAVTHVVLSGGSDTYKCSDWKYVAPGEYWVVISEGNSYETSATAPTGWITDKVEDESIDKKGDFDMAVVSLVLFAGVALVAVGVVNKKKFA